MHEKNILITGASKRIGKTLAIGLAKHGWNIAAHYNKSKSENDFLIEEITKTGQKAVNIQADLSDIKQVQQLIDTAHDKLGPLQALINNASIFEPDHISDINTPLTSQSWDQHLNINLKAPAFLMRDFANKFCIQNDTQGNIINMIDQRVWRLNPNFMSYTVSKVALWSLTQSLAQTFATQNIRVNAIGPGATLPSTRQTQELFDKQRALLPLQHLATPEDILEACLYILNSKTMTGQMIALDSGQHLAWETPDIIGVVE